MPIPSLQNPIEYIFVHCTGVSRFTNPDQWHQTNLYHQQQWNFRSSLGCYAGYTYEIAADGTIRQARQEGEETAAVIGYNKNSVSICLDGDFDTEQPTQAQASSLRQLLVEVQSRHNVPIKNIVPHRFACGNPPRKTCYGNLLANDWAQRLIIDPASIHVFTDPYNPVLGAIENRDLEAA